VSLTKDWMVEDNLGKTPASRDRRALDRAISTCVATACLMEGQRKVVGAGFAHIKGQLSEDELIALQHATSLHLDLPTPSPLPDECHR
jgi:hypothetical protein